MPRTLVLGVDAASEWAGSLSYGSVTLPMERRYCSVTPTLALSEGLLDLVDVVRVLEEPHRRKHGANRGDARPGPQLALGE